MKEKLKELLALHEGLRLKPYRDTVGKLTIGYGRNLEDVGISKEEADFMLDNDIEKACYLAHTNLPWFEDLNEPRKLVILSMIFNMGLAGLMKFQKMIEAIRANDYDKAQEEMLNSLWARQVKDRAIMLSKMMRRGEYFDDERGAHG